MNRVIVDIQPFLKNQTIQYYTNDSLESEDLVDLIAIPDIIKSYCKTDNLKQIDFFGSKIFGAKFKKDILKFTDFEKINDINIIVH